MAVLAVALLLPLAGLPFQSREALEQFHNRTLAGWPGGGLLRRDPALYFRRGNAWFADRAYPLIAATRLSKSFLYAAFHVTPQANVSVSRDGFAFLAGGDVTHPYSFLVNTCLSEPDAGLRLQSAIDDIGRYARAKHYAIDVVLVPTIPTLYGDRLPRSIPAGYRAACAARVSGNSPLSGIHSVEGTRYVYPRTEMLARRNDPAFFPIGDYHPTGLSVQVVRTAYFNAIGAEAKVSEDVAPTWGPAEVLQDLGVDVDVPQYDISSASLEADDAASHTMEPALARFYSQPRYPVGVRQPPPRHPAARPDDLGLLRRQRGRKLRRRLQEGHAGLGAGAGCRGSAAASGAAHSLRSCRPALQRRERPPECWRSRRALKAAMPAPVLH